MERRDNPEVRVPVNATQLAEALSVSKARISQLVADGTLDGCWEWNGRRRVFDPRKAAKALDRKLDLGQQLGNGAAAEAARRRLLDGADEEPAPPQREGGKLRDDDDDRYRLARTLKAEEEARKLRRQNAEEEGRYVLAEQAAREARRLMAGEISGFETVIREGARAVADQLGVDAKRVRAILRTAWRQHRAERAETLRGEAGAAAMTEAEKGEDI